MITRRQLLKTSAAASLALSVPGLTFATIGEQANRFVLIILRGGLDGLAAIPPYGDVRYRKARGRLALPSPGRENGILDLDGFFGLHPRLANLHRMFKDGDLVAIHGTAPPYVGRSHFDAQNVLESGGLAPHALKSGWLYRSLAGIDDARDLESLAMSIGSSVPLVLRGDVPVGSWAPDRLPEPDDDTMARVLALYEQDEILGPRLDSMMATEEMLDDMGNAGGGRGNPLQQLASRTSEFLNHDSGPQVAVLESGGWDTHANQGIETCQLAARLQALDSVLANLKRDLGKNWDHTVVLLVTEFGRTVAVNGTRGTDHGAGGAALLLGGAVKGGRVIADWQGLHRNQLFEGRDLVPSIDHRAIFKSVLVQHLGVDGNYVDEVAFPGSNQVKPLPGLFRHPVG